MCVWCLQRTSGGTGVSAVECWHSAREWSLPGLSLEQVEVRRSKTSPTQTRDPTLALCGFLSTSSWAWRKTCGSGIYFWVPRSLFAHRYSCHHLFIQPFSSLSFWCMPRLCQLHSWVQTRGPSCAGRNVTIQIRSCLCVWLKVLSYFGASEVWFSSRTMPDLQTMTSYCGVYLQRGCVVPAHAMVISFLSGLFSGQSAYSRSSGTCYLGGDGGEQAVAFSHFISIVGVWTY